ncbi:transcription repressor NadR [Ornithinibacillus halophilus]|uniref:Transcriptional regulator n=1 Tax=Ornithinibacillus halophilus TaxID=930117 RepID=A0A1M5MI81_9BACI|nr:transcription repressor NadR [Ornithinibacillus halophilus]SHG76921.1 hypothetical protein SAMN05216225_105915 [Ornithinibacillus halophilus]
MQHDEKVLGENRRNLILSWLKESQEPLTGKLLAERTNVSRQVIVQDVSLLKAKGEPIMATSRGYVYLQDEENGALFSKIIVVSHQPEETEDELNTLVDHGVTVKNVMVEHPIYGDLTGSLMLKNRRDVQIFITELKEKKVSLLSDLTNGVHIHTIEAETKQQLDEVCEVLKAKGYLLE